MYLENLITYGSYIINCELIRVLFVSTNNTISILLLNKLRDVYFYRPVRRAVKGRRSGKSGKPKSAGRPKTGHLSDSDSWSEDDARKFETRHASKKVRYYLEIGQLLELF